MPNFDEVDALIDQAAMDLGEPVQPVPEHPQLPRISAQEPVEYAFTPSVDEKFKQWWNVIGPELQKTGAPIEQYDWKQVFLDEWQPDQISKSLKQDRLVDSIIGAASNSVVAEQAEKDAFAESDKWFNSPQEILARADETVNVGGVERPLWEFEKERHLYNQYQKAAYNTGSESTPEGFEAYKAAYNEGRAKSDVRAKAKEFAAMPVWRGPEQAAAALSSGMIPEEYSQLFLDTFKYETQRKGEMEAPESNSGDYSAAPFVGGILQSGVNQRKLELKEKMEAHKNGSAPLKGNELRQARGELLAEVLKDEVKAIRGTSFASDAESGVARSAGFMLEMYATKGLFNLLGFGKKVGQIAGAIEKTSDAAKAAKWLKEASALATVGAATVGLPRVYEKTLKHKYDGDGLAQALYKGFGDQWIEYFSEETGGAIGAVAGKIVSKVPVLNKLSADWVRKTGGTSAEFAEKLFKKAGFHGIVQEMGEERVGDALRAIGDIESFGLKGEENTVWNRLKASIPDARDIALELTTFAIPMAGQHLTARLMGQGGPTIDEYLADLKKNGANDEDLEEVKKQLTVESWIADNPELAIDMLENGQNSRKAFKALGIEGANSKEDREEWVNRTQAALSVSARYVSEGSDGVENIHEARRQKLDEKQDRLDREWLDAQTMQAAKYASPSLANAIIKVNKQLRVNRNARRADIEAGMSMPQQIAPRPFEVNQYDPANIEDAQQNDIRFSSIDEYVEGKGVLEKVRNLEIDLGRPVHYSDIVKRFGASKSTAKDWVEAYENSKQPAPQQTSTVAPQENKQPAEGPAHEATQPQVEKPDWAKEQKDDSPLLYSARNDEDGTIANVYKSKDFDQFNIVLVDKDSGKTVGSSSSKSLEDAKNIADSIVAGKNIKATQEGPVIDEGPVIKNDQPQDGKKYEGHYTYRPGDGKWLEVKGHPVKTGVQWFDDKYESVATRNKEGGWTIHESSTGRWFGGGDTKEEAILDAQKNLNTRVKDVNKFHEVIQDLVKKSPSPRGRSVTKEIDDTIVVSSVLQKLRNRNAEKKRGNKNENKPEAQPEPAKDESPVINNEKNQEGVNQEQETEPTPDAADIEAKEKKLVTAIEDKLVKRLRLVSSGMPSVAIKRAELEELAEEVYGGKLSEGKFDNSDLYNAIERAVNVVIRDIVQPKTDVGAEGAAENIAKINKLMRLLPKETARSDEQTELQQFSTPPEYAYVAAWVANLRNSDKVLEPSAGVGGLVAVPSNVVSTLYLNEYSKRRTETLKIKDVPDRNNSLSVQYFNEDGAQVNNILAGRISPTVVIMNPPFSNSATGVKSSSVENDHVNAALSLLPENGRLVAIVSAPLFGATPPGKVKWFAELAKNNRLRANITVQRNVYAGYGTTYPTRILVIDKGNPDPNLKTVTGEAESLDKLLRMLEEVRNARLGDTGEQGSGRAGDKEGAPKGGGEVSSEGAIQPSTSGGIHGEARNPDSKGLVSGGSGNSGGGNSNAKPSKGRSSKATAVAGNDNGVSEELTKPGVENSGNAVGEGDRETEREGSQISVSEKEREKIIKDVADDVVFESYEPARLKIKGAKPHPSSLVESSAMASVLPPAPTYTPNLPNSVVENGVLSIVQLEAVVYAGMAHQKFLPKAVDAEIPVRAGFFIGDGTGVGKGREWAGILMDNWRQGRKKAVIVTEKATLQDDAIRDWTALGGSKSDIFELPDVREDIKQSEGILFVPYSTLSVGGKQDKKSGDLLRSRAEQVLKWLGKDFDGVVIFDESHNMKNANPDKKGMDPSNAGMVGVEFQNSIPNARIVYCSATGATEIANLAYAQRLGLWGRGTPFASANDFTSQMAQGGVAAMETIARDLKAMGRYLSRGISFNDGTKDGTVTFERLSHELTSNQVKMYDRMCEAWQVVFKNMNAAIKVTRGKFPGSAFWSSEQRFFNQVLTAITAPSVIDSIEKNLEKDGSIVIQLVNTMESAANREIKKRLAGRKMKDVSEDDNVLDGIDLGPRDILINLVKTCFPVQQWVEVPNDNGGTKYVPALDSQGNPILNQEAVKMRDDMLEDLKHMPIPDSFMDTILHHFGHDNVAEITGRKNRIVKTKDSTKLMSRGSNTVAVNIAETNAFQSGKKRILIFSGAGGTGRSYHAAKDAQNQQKRYHYIAQAGWSADKAMQGLGRTHRSNQVLAPHFILCETNIKAHKRFISSVARRLGQLGALTKGDRKGATGLFNESDNLESREAQHALNVMLNNFDAGNIEFMTYKEFLALLGLEKTKSGEVNTNMQQFLNRLLAVPFDKQNKIFDLYTYILDRVVENAKKAGSLDVGVETYRADRIVPISSAVVWKDQETGSETSYSRMKAGYKTTPIKFEEAADKSLRFVKSVKTGAIYSVKDTGGKKQDYKTGDVVPLYRLYAPVLENSKNVAQQTVNAEAGRYYETLTPEDAKVEWEKQLKAAPEFFEKDIHIITGMLLPIWDKLAGHPKIYRIKTVSGEQVLGRIIQPENLSKTLKALGQTPFAKMKTEDILAKLKAGATVELSNHLILEQRKVRDEKRIQISGHRIENNASLLSSFGVIHEVIYYTDVYTLPTGEKEADALDKVLKEFKIADVIERGSAAKQAAAEADEGDEADELGAGIALVSARNPVRSGVVPTQIQVDDKETEDRLQRNRGVEHEPIIEKIKQFANEAVAKITRAQEHIPNTVRFAGFNEFFRLIKGVPSSTQDEAIRRVSSIIDPMSKEQLQLFERKLIVDDVLAGDDRGESLRYFKTRADAEAYRDKLDRLIAMPESAAVRKALQNRQAIVAELVDKLIEKKLLPESVRSRDAYFHRQVMSYMDLNRIAGNRSGKVRRVKHSFQHKRLVGVDIGEDLDYNTNYIESETEWMTNALVELRKIELMDQFITPENKMDDLLKEAKKKGIKDWEKLVGKGKWEGYRLWQPIEGNYFFKAWTVPQKYIEEAVKNMAFTLDVPIEDVSRVLAMGSKREQYLLPVEVADQLDATEKAKPSDMVDKVVRLPIQSFKWIVTSAPWNIFGYSARNFTGDSGFTFVGAPGILKEAFSGEALGELYRYYRGNLSLSDDLRAARDLAVIGSSFSAEELPDLQNTLALRQYGDGGSYLNGVMDQLRRFNEFREAVLRYAAFKYFKKQLQAGTLTEFGGSNSDLIRELHKTQGVDVAAAKLSRDLLGDYANITVFGDWLRKYAIPFHAYQEINLKRYPRAISNAYKNKGIKGGSVAAAAAGTALGTWAATRIGLGYALLWLWNNMVRDDDEEKLTPQDTSQMHINLGQNDDGSVRVFRRVGSLGDILEWAGINEALRLWDKYSAGQAGLDEVLNAMWKSPLNKIIQGARPDIKIPLEVISGKTYYPDVTQPRTISRDDAIAGAVDLRDEWKAVKGWLTGDGSRARPHMGQRWLGLGVVDQRDSAMSEMHDLRNSFLKQKGKDVPQIDGGSKAIGNMRRAAARGNQEAFDDARRAYLAEGKTFESFSASLRKLDPVAERLKDDWEKEFEQEFLTVSQREKLKIARDYAQDLRISMFSMWQKSVEGGSAEAKSANDQAVDHETTSYLMRLTAPKPVLKGRKEDREQYAERLQRWQEGVEKARTYMKEHGVNRAKAESLLRKGIGRHGAHEIQEREARQRRWLSFRRAWVD